ncbi:MAG: lytic transglycosylase domain-containing protein [Ignavibacteriaceae bacterium]
MIIKRQKLFYFLSGLLTALIIFFIIGSLVITGDEDLLGSPAPDDFPQGYKIVSPKMPENLEFAGEKIPVGNFEVYERMEREFLANTYWHSATLLALKRANRWFPVIEPILKKNNIPDDFKYLSVAESNLDNVVSPVGASGFWQFMEETGKRYGLEINSQVDERYNLEKATEAACKYLRNSYNMFGSWTAVAASYNMGYDGVKKQMDRQKAKNYFNLSLNSETYRFVGRIVSLKYIMSSPAEYGYDLSEDDLYQPLEYDEITLNTSVQHFADYAADFGINYATLKLYNPWLRENKLDNKTGRTYAVKIPKEGTIEIIKD